MTRFAFAARLLVFVPVLTAGAAVAQTKPTVTSLAEAPSSILCIGNSFCCYNLQNRLTRIAASMPSRAHPQTVAWETVQHCDGR